MSLYDGILDDKEVVGRAESKPELSGWSSSFKMLHSQVQAKKRANQQPKRRSGATLAPVIDLKKNTPEQEIYFNQITGKAEMRALGVSTVPTSPFIANEPQPSLTNFGVDEYDPLRPNEYEEVVKKRKEHKREKEEPEKKPEERRRRYREEPEEEPEMTEFEKRRRRRAEEDEEEVGFERPKRTAGAAIAPPAILMEDNQPSNDSEEESNPNSGPNTPRRGDPGDMSPPRPGLGVGPSFGLLGNSVASKIMARYGYKEGQGLGKKEQGMSTALQVEKTSKRGGKIIHERDIPKGCDLFPAVTAMEPPRAPQPTTADLLKNPSKVILLRNMVGPGEVDDDLEPETAEECTKYGKVTKCVIFEMPGAVEEEAVRIFIEFERVESAIKGVVDLNGRYFGGRIVKACFYNLDKFRRLDLADPILT